MIYVLGGGGGTKLFAAIGVTYPTGSTVTCTNGTKTLTPKNTNGQWAFAIPEAGEWTVTATQGINTKTTKFEITKEGQWESWVVTYREYLIKNGESVVNHSSSTANISTETDASGNSYLRIGYGGSSWSGTGHYYYAIDVTNYNTLFLDGLTKYYQQGNGLAKFGVGKTSGTTYTGSTDIQLTQGEFTFNVSNYTGTVYVIVSAGGYETSTQGWFSSSAYVANLWLE